MRTSSLVALLLLAFLGGAAAQVISPMELEDPTMRYLQQQHLQQLQAVGTEINQHSFPYPFYFSRRLDIDETEQKSIDQRSIRFERYNGQPAVEITGNYYASYSAERLDVDRRVRQTYVDLILPILRSVVPKLLVETKVELFAIEVSHHVRKKVMGVDSEYPENVVVVVQRDVAAKLMRAKDLSEQQQIMVDAEVYHDNEPMILWLTGDKPVLDESRVQAYKSENSSSRSRGAVQVTPALTTNTRGTGNPFAAAPRTVPEELRVAPLHDSSPDSLKALQESHQQEIDKMLRELDATAHFVTYAPPSFIGFKQGAYLQLSLTTTLAQSAEGSQYKLAALAFDQHIAHLLRPVLGYLADTSKFDGIDFSTTVKIAGSQKEPDSEAVEFILPFSALRCYQAYDCTGQQLLTSGIVLINGERVGIDLQTAESTTPH